MQVRPVQITALSASLDAPVRRLLHVHGWVRDALQVRDQVFLTPATIKHTYVMCTEESVLAVIGACIHALSVSSAFVFVPPAVRLADVILRLSKIGVKARAASDHVNGLAAERMLAERAALTQWLTAGTKGHSRILVATTEAVSSAFFALFSVDKCASHTRVFLSSPCSLVDRFAGST